MKLLNLNECKLIAGAFTYNQYPGYSTVKLSQSDSFFYLNGGVSMRLYYKGPQELMINDAALLAHGASGTSPFTGDGISFGGVTIVGFYDDYANYIIYDSVVMECDL